MSYCEEFFQNYDFRKVQIILNMFYIYDFSIRHVLTEIQRFEATRKILIFWVNYLQKFALRVFGMDNLNILAFKNATHDISDQ